MLSIHRFKWRTHIWSSCWYFCFSLSRATESHSHLVNQRKRLESSRSKIVSVFSRLPAVNQLMRKISDKKTRDNIIVAFVMACCICFCIWYILHYPCFQKTWSKRVQHITRIDKRHSLPQAAAAFQHPQRSLHKAGSLRTDRRSNRADVYPLPLIAGGLLLSPKQEVRSPQLSALPRSELDYAGDTSDESLRCFSPPFLDKQHDFL